MSLSLTLRDAQHLSWKTFKKFESLDKERSESHYSAAELIKKSNEINEKIKGFQTSSPPAKEELSKLFSELLFSLFVLSERYGIILEDSFLQALDELILRFVS